MPSVLLVVFDGLQPAQVTPPLMPHLSAFAAEGVIFRRHHAVFPSVTRINVASMVTGCNPGGHGLAANTLVIREFDPEKAISALEPTLAQVALKTGRVLLRPTVADILSRWGQRFVAVGVGSTGNAYLQNPHAESSGGATIHPQFCLPYRLHDEVVGRFGPWPPEAKPNSPQMAHAVRVMTEYVLPELDPAVSLIWLSEPDSAQHAEGVGSKLGNRALADADRAFAGLLEWLDASGRAADTDVLVVSDHGYSTVEATWDIEAEVRRAGFPAAGYAGAVVVAPNGGAVLFYTDGADAETADRLAAWLTSQPWCGALLASGAGVAGTLPASLAGAEGSRAPELAMSFAWGSRPNRAGYPGHAHSCGGAPGLGLHGSMSRHEMRNVLLARGPRFKKGLAVNSPSGNVDIAPTLLRLIGRPGAEGMDGRVLEEALAGGPDPREVKWTSEVFTSHRGGYRQQVTVSRVGATAYVDEGNATHEGG